MTPIRQPNSLSQLSSFTCTNDSHEEFLRQRPVGCGSCLDPSQTTGQYISDHQLPASSDMRSLALSYGNTHGEDSHGPIPDPGTGTTESVESSCTESTPAQGRSRTTKVPQRSRKLQHRKLVKKSRNRPQSRSKTVIEPRKSANVFKLWKWEIFNCVFAFGMLESMHGILLHYDGQRIPDWGSAINLSTLIALMATLLRTMLVFVVSEIIGQAKWDYFAGGARPKGIAPVRRLIETSRFNEASQGMLGAVKFLPTIIRDPATFMAVMVMILSLGTGSFVQQAIQTQSCQFPVNSAHASLPVSRQLTREGVTFSDPYAAASLALAPESESIGSPISVECDTGNCTFQNSIGGMYSTMGICSSCVDTSSLISSTEKQCDEAIENCLWFTANVTLPNGMSMYNETRHYNSTGPDNMPKHYNKYTTQLLVTPTEDLDWADDLVSQDMKVSSQWAMENIAILAPQWQLPTTYGFSGFDAVSCTLYLCLRSYTGEVRSGKPDEVLVGTTPALPDVGDSGKVYNTTNFGAVDEVAPADAFEFAKGWMSVTSDFKAVQSPCLVNGTIWTKEQNFSNLDLQRLVFAHSIGPDPGGARYFIYEEVKAPAECIYSASVDAVLLLGEIALTTFNATCYVIIENEVGDLSAPGAYCGEIGDDTWLQSFLDEKGTTAASIIKRIEAFTDRLSNKMRMGLLNHPDTVSGQVLQMTVCSRIQYSWLAFPAVLVATTSGLLAWTMFWSSRRQGRVMVWKTSILPFLFYSEGFVVQNGEDVSADSTERLRRAEGAKEPLLDLDQLETEAKQRKVRFDMFD